MRAIFQVLFCEIIIENKQTNIIIGKVMGYVLNFLCHVSFFLSNHLYEESFTNTETMLRLQRMKCQLVNNYIYLKLFYY